MEAEIVVARAQGRGGRRLLSNTVHTLRVGHGIPMVRTVPQPVDELAHEHGLPL